MRRWHIKSTCAAALVLLITGVGCNSQPSGDVIKTVPAGGVLTYKGQPLEYYKLTFYSDDVPRPVGAISDSEGKFMLGTNREGDGAPSGSYRVSVVYVGPASSDPNEGIMEFSPPPKPKVNIPKKYHRPETSEIVVSIAPGGDRELKVDL